MRKTVSILLSMLFFAAAAAAHDIGEIAPAEDGDGWKTVEIEGMTLSWREMDDSFSFRAEAPTEGWVAVGFGGGPAMKDASMIMGYADEDGAHFRDDHGTSPVSHSPDIELGGTDDIMEADVQESDGTTTFSFTLPMEPSDELDPVLTPGETIRILVAWGNSDGFTGMHSEAHTAELEL